MSIKDLINQSIATKQKLLDDPYVATIEQAATAIISALKTGNKVLIAGNGGSAADAQHFAAELIGKFETQRKGLPAIALTTNSSNITAIGNDFDFEQVFSRPLDSLGTAGDVFIGISTSGNSKNIIAACNTAKSKKITAITLTGRDGGILKNQADITIVVPSENTARIQESHILIIHIICSLIDQAFTQ